MNHKLKLGQALVITGPEGCGKTTIARQIAAACGTYEEISAEEFDSPFGLSPILKKEPKTLIIDGIPRNQLLLKKMIVNDQVQVNTKYQVPKVVSTTNLIICAGQSHWIESNDRRFYVIDLNSQQLTESSQ